MEYKYIYKAFIRISDITTMYSNSVYIAQFFEIVKQNRKLQNHELITYVKSLRNTTMYEV